MRDVGYQVVFYGVHYDAHSVDVIVLELLHNCNVLRLFLFSCFKLWFHDLAFHDIQHFILGKDEVNPCNIPYIKSMQNRNKMLEMVE
jgi:hypothetical protein